MNRGFTLIESLITTLVLVTGLAAVASAFSYSVTTSLRIQQQTAAFTLVSAKLEELRMESGLLPGHYFQDLSVAQDGSVLLREPQNATYRETWEITAEVPSRITVIVWARQTRPRSFIELARATTVIGWRPQV
jgi:prepilin-type N-terminal cleavage/methylation domain-containing protein